MENKLNTVPEDISQDFFITDDDISLSNFAISGHENDDDDDAPSRRASNSSDAESFEFFHREVNEYRKRDYLCLKSASFHKSQGFEWDHDDDYNTNNHHEELNLSRSGSTNRCRAKPSATPVRKVNITALTDMSAKSRRRMFMFGPVKFKPEMDVEAIRKRRSRLGPVNIPPMPEEISEKKTEMKIVKSTGGGMMRPLWCRSHLATALAKSFGCVPGSMV